MAMVTLQTAAEMEAAQAAAASGEKKNPLAGMNVLTAQGQEPGQKGIQITEKALVGCGLGFRVGDVRG
jgi:iron-sulfur cluster assembly protein